MAGAATERAGVGLALIVCVVLESGILNTAYLFVYVMTLNFGSQGLEIMSGMVRIAITFQVSNPNPC